MRERIESLKRVVKWGLDNGKTNMMVDLDLLAAILQLATPLYCEHWISDGEWCEDCNREMHRAELENGAKP